MKKEENVIYYTDLLNDEFSTAVIIPKKIDGSWVYVHKSLWKRFTRFFWYRVVAYPFGWLFLKLKFRHKIVNRKILPKEKGNAYFLYGNHTQTFADPFVPTMLSAPKSMYVIVHPNNVSMPYLGRITPSLGALPLPDDMAASRNFMAAIKQRIEEGSAVCIYPEAHIWPYYTKIRPFGDAAFGYPLKLDKPCYCFTNTYQKNGKKVQMVTYIDGPFYPDKSLPLKLRKKDLRDRVYEKMVERSKNSNVEVIKYIRRESND